MMPFLVSLPSISIDRLFAISLTAGFAFALLLLLSGGRLLRVTSRVRLPRVRVTRLLGRIRVPRLRGHVTDRAPGPPWAAPLVVGLFLTLFGATGLALRQLVGLGPAASVAGAAGWGIAASIAAVRLIGRYLADGDAEIRGGALLGAVGRVSLAIPEGGVGAVAYLAAGKRATMPARAKSGSPLAPGSRVVILAIRDRVALVESL